MGQIKGIRSTVEIEIYGPADLSTASFTAHVRETAKSTTLLGTLTTASEITVTSEAVVDPDPGYEWRTVIAMVFPETMSDDFTDKVVTDLVRTDTTPDQYLGFKLEIDWETPVTRVCRSRFAFRPPLSAFSRSSPIKSSGFQFRAPPARAGGAP